MQRIRKGFTLNTGVQLPGPVEVDKTYIGGLEKNKHKHKKINAGRDTVGKKAVVGISASRIEEPNKSVLRWSMTRPKRPFKVLSIPMPILILRSSRTKIRPMRAFPTANR